MDSLHVHRFGPDDRPVQVLAVHGLTGHGKRWSTLTSDELPGVRVLAPDLRGHGHSPWTPPWTIEGHVADLAALLRREATAPVVLVAHSFGAMLSIHLARTVPELIGALVLLDPAIGLDPKWALQVADLTIASPDYTDVAEARSDKQHGGWTDVPAAVLEHELVEHLVELPSGRVGWRVSTPAAIAAWGEMARDFVLPPAGLRTVLVQAMRVQPPFVTDDFRTALRAHLADRLTVHDVDCDHMIPQARPDVVGRLVRELL
ncbi:alpha/beta hydrolase [Rhodococcus sp. D2-41]|uniref:alpha/beta fold hydrolase n=1 Tax=Speluncibacter jeojiensis TaxID=2710754 RepID=UPI00240F840C|nr:alpha/beta hydrolase [Rhodococcus sp. D2-41]MDG3008735.1 alpha/beta hydrolase [Rhodococcus sp. D2-41]